MNLLYIAKLSDDKLKEKLYPISLVDKVDKIFVLRDVSGITFSDKISYIVPKKRYKGIINHISRLFLGIKFCRKNKIDAVVGVLNTPHAYMARIISIFCNVPMIYVVIAGQREFWRNGALFEKFNLLFFKHCKYITVTGLQTKKYLIENGYKDTQIIVLPNIPDDFYSSIQQVGLIYDRKYDICFMSRIDKNKNLSLLLHAIALLKDSLPLKIVIVGNGDELDKMKELSKELNIGYLVEFKGYISDMYVKKNIYCNSKLFVSASRGEGFPVSLLEAMCCGCVPIVSNVGDCIDKINFGVNGLYFNDLDNEYELMSCIKKCFCDKLNLQQMSNEAKKIQTQVTPINIVNVWTEIISKN